jgi:mRNA interferase MazF
MNKNLKTVIIAPLTSTLRDFPTRLDVVVKRKNGQIVLDQLRTVDKDRLGAKVSKLSEAKSMKVKRILLEIFQ